MLDFGERKQLDCERRLIIKKKHQHALARVLLKTIRYSILPAIFPLGETIDKLKLNKFQIIFFSDKQFQSIGKIKMSRISFFSFEKVNFNFG